MNRQILETLISQATDKELKSEIDYFMEVDREYEYTPADALSDIYDEACSSNLRRLKKLINLMFIEAGYLIKRTGHVMCLGSDKHETVNKVKYDFKCGYEDWINE